MRWVNILDDWLGQFDFTSTFQIVVIVLVLFKIFALQRSEQLDFIVERTPSKYGWLRRCATTIESITWLWVVLYLYEVGRPPAPPIVFLAIAALLNVMARLVIVHWDYCRARRLGRQVAALADAIPSIKRSSRGN